MFFNQFEIIPIVAETKSFSKAGKLLHISQPAISSKIQAMEDYYKVKLFNRTSQGVTLTEAGKIICAYAVRFLDMHNSMEEDINELLNTDSKYLTIGASCTVGNYAMPCSIYAFKGKYPEARIKLDIGNTESILEKLKNKEIDIAVVEGKVENPDFISYNIDTSNLVFIASNEDNNRKYKKEISLKELSAKPFILREQGSAMRIVLEKALAQYGYSIDDLNIVSEMTSIHAVKELVSGGLGISLVPAIAIEKEYNTGTLRTLKIKEFVSDLDMDVNLVYLNYEEPVFITEKFIRFITRKEAYDFCWNLRRVF